MDNKLIIRTAKRDESPIILKFIKALADYENLTNEVVINESDIIKNIFENQYANVLLLEVENKVIGFAVYFYSFSTFLGKPGLYLEDFFIEETMRGKGYGKATLAYLAKIAKLKGCARFEWSCLKWNTPAIKVYEKMKAKQLEEWVQFRLTGSDLDELASKCHQEIKLKE